MSSFVSSLSPARAYDALSYMYDYSVQHALFAHKFTGKERDAECGLDMFGARYYASTMGG